MRDRLEIGSTPHAEDCEQLGPSYDPQRAKAECRAFRNQIIRHYGEVDGARLVITSNAHDFGTYHEIAVSYDENDEAQVEYAFRIEEDALNALENWDEAARAELGLA
jgi:hypothetical protein